MSIKNLASNNLSSRTLKSNKTWIRNPSWEALPVVGPTDKKFVGLMAIYPDSNFQSFKTTGVATTVDWGDGFTETVGSGVQALHQYDFNDVDLAGTDAPVTLTDSGDLITRTAHGYQDGMTVRFYNIVSTTGLVVAQPYYVINSTVNTFQIANTVNGTAIALTTDGTATLLPYKQAIITVTPNNSSAYSIDFNLKHTQAGLQKYDSQFLDIEVGSTVLSATGLSFGGGGTTVINFNMLERVALRNLGSLNTFGGMFNGMKNLQSVIISGATNGITTCANMFQNCRALTSAPLFDTSSVTSMNNMFSGCLSLTYVPLYNTASVTNMSSMFASCVSLVGVPLFNTSQVTTTSFMFSLCASLTYVPLFNTSSVLFMNSMFANCTSLVGVPLFNTSTVTDMSTMFANDGALMNVPLFNTIAVTSMATMFSGCVSLTVVPRFDTSSVTSMASMFNGCVSLAVLPLFDTSLVTTMNSMLTGCDSLTSLPAWSPVALSNTTSWLACPQLSNFGPVNVPVSFTISGCKLSQTALQAAFSNLPSKTGQTITISTTNWGGPALITKASSGTTAGSATITIANTSSLATGMEVTGTGISTGVAVTFTDTGDTVNLASHNLSNGTMVSFSSITSTTGIVVYTPYYVVNATGGTFQVSDTIGGSAKALTTNGSGTVLYPTTITAITTNTNITVSVPPTATGSITISAGLLKRSYATLRGWTVA